MNNKQQLGVYGENLIATKLEHEGFKILARNYKKRSGEIDLIAAKQSLLVFVEVKMRRSPLFDLAEVITRSKQQKILTVAKQFIVTHNHKDSMCRFDVALIEMRNAIPHITYIPNAFGEDG